MSFPTVTVEVDFGVDPSSSYLILDDAARGILDARQLGPTEGVSSDITDYVRSFSIDMGKPDALTHYKEGTSVTTLSNDDGRFDDENLSGPYVSGGVSQVKPMRRIRHKATWGGTEYDLSECFTDDWVCEYPKKVDNVTVVPATDYLKVLGRQKNAEASAPSGEGDTPGERIGRLLDSMSIPDGDRDLDGGTVTLQATTLVQTVRDEAFACADAEAGDLFVDKAGRITLRDRYWLFEDSRSRTTQATFSDNPAALAAGTALPYFDIKRANDADLVRNKVSIARTGGETQTVEDTESQATYFEQPFESTDLPLDDDDDALLIANGMLYLYSEKRSRFDELILKPRKSVALWPVVLGAQFGDLWSVTRTLPFGTVTKECHVIGIRHDVDWSSKSWTSRFRLQDASLYTDCLILDDATLGKLDTGTLAPL